MTEDNIVMIWLYEDLMEHSEYFIGKNEYLKSLYDEMKQEDDENRIRILQKMINIIEQC